jgi:hypothetical protein
MTTHGLAARACGAASRNGVGTGAALQALRLQFEEVRHFRDRAAPTDENVTTGWAPASPSCSGAVQDELAADGPQEDPLPIPTRTGLLLPEDD